MNRSKSSQIWSTRAWRGAPSDIQRIIEVAEKQVADQVIKARLEADLELKSEIDESSGGSSSEVLKEIAIREHERKIYYLLPDAAIEYSNGFSSRVTADAREIAAELDGPPIQGMRIDIPNASVGGDQISVSFGDRGISLLVRGSSSAWVRGATENMKQELLSGRPGGYWLSSSAVVVAVAFGVNVCLYLLVALSLDDGQRVEVEAAIALSMASVAVALAYDWLARRAVPAFEIQTRNRRNPLRAFFYWLVGAAGAGLIGWVVAEAMARV